MQRKGDHYELDQDCGNYDDLHSAKQSFQFISDRLFHDYLTTG